MLFLCVCRFYGRSVFLTDCFKTRYKPLKTIQQNGSHIHYKGNPHVIPLPLLGGASFCSHQQPRLSLQALRIHYPGTCGTLWGKPINGSSSFLACPVCGSHGFCELNPNSRGSCLRSHSVSQSKKETLGYESWEESSAAWSPHSTVRVGSHRLDVMEEGMEGNHVLRIHRQLVNNKL